MVFSFLFIFLFLIDVVTPDRVNNVVDKKGTDTSVISQRMTGITLSQNADDVRSKISKHSYDNTNEKLGVTSEVSANGNFKGSILLDSICSTNPNATQSCWNAVNQTFTCIPAGTLCCGNGGYCAAGTRCHEGNTCIAVTESYSYCPPPSFPAGIPQLYEACYVYKSHTGSDGGYTGCMLNRYTCCGDGSSCPYKNTCQMYPYCCGQGNILCYNNIDKEGGCMPDDGSVCCYDGSYCPSGYYCSLGTKCCPISASATDKDCTVTYNIRSVAPASAPNGRPTGPGLSPSISSLQPAYTRNPIYASVAPTLPDKNPNVLVLNTNAVIAVSIVSIAVFCCLLYILFYYLLKSHQQHKRLLKFEEWTMKDIGRQSYDEALVSLTQSEHVAGTNQSFIAPDSARSNNGNGNGNDNSSSSSNNYIVRNNSTGSNNGNGSSVNNNNGVINESPRIGGKVLTTPRITPSKSNTNMNNINISSSNNNSNHSSHGLSSSSATATTTTGAGATAATTTVTPVASKLAFSINDFVDDDDDDEVNIHL